MGVAVALDNIMPSPSGYHLAEDSRKGQKRSNDSISVWLCNAYSQHWQSVDLAVGASQKDSRASAVQVPSLPWACQAKASPVSSRRREKGPSMVIYSMFWAYFGFKTTL